MTKYNVFPYHFIHIYGLLLRKKKLVNDEVYTFLFVATSIVTRNGWQWWSCQLIVFFPNRYDWWCRLLRQLAHSSMVEISNTTWGRYTFVLSFIDNIHPMPTHFLILRSESIPVRGVTLVVGFYTVPKTDLWDNLAIGKKSCSVNMAMRVVLNWASNYYTFLPNTIPQ